MRLFALGTKGEMSQHFQDDGARVPVTHIRVDDCTLIGVKDLDKDGYRAVKLGVGTKKSVKKPAQGMLKKAGIEARPRYIAEIRISDDVKSLQKEGKSGVLLNEKEIFAGDTLQMKALLEGVTHVRVTGVSKGKGFQGVVKRHGFAGGPRTHGQSDRERAPGSIGQGTTPGRVYKGKKMAGRMGSQKTTIKNLQVIDIEDGVLRVKGLVPGAKGGLLLLSA